MQVTLKSITPNSEVNIVEIARVSSTREDKSAKPEGLINYLIKNKHWSPFEHAFFTVEIVTSRAISAQLCRHRSFTFQEFSQRYASVVGMEDMELRLQASTNRQSSTDVIAEIFGNLVEPMAHSFNRDKFGAFAVRVASFLDSAFKLYTEGIELGIAKECMRGILPMTTRTSLYMTGSVRSWIHFLQIRDDAHAQKEIQLIAKDIKRIFIGELPIISKALEFSTV